MENINQTLIVPEKLGKRIKELRNDLGLSQAEVAGDFISLRTLQKIEKGETTPTFEVLLHIANQLHVEMFELVISSRIPYYFEYEFPRLVDLVLGDFENSRNTLHLQDLEALEKDLKEFSSVKLPYNESVRLETFSTLLFAFIQKNRGIAAEVLGNYMGKMVLKPDAEPTETELFQISLYLRMEKNERVLEDFLDNLYNYPRYFYHPTIAYNIGLLLYREQRWAEMENLARITLRSARQDEIDSLYPYIYCQAGISLFKQNKENGVTIFEQGLQLLNLLRQEDGFNIMLQQAKKDEIPITKFYEDMLF
jgi:Predicted transcription factor, homolog of eukaryotic MBF1